MNELKQHSGLSRTQLLIVGALAIILGVMVMLAPTLTGYSIILLIGVLVGAAGLARMYWAFRIHSLQKGLLLFGLGMLTFILGIAMVTHPIFGAGVLTTILTVYFVLDGAIEISTGYLLKPGPGWLWLIGGGCVSILLGILLMLQFPFSGAWAIGILLGIKLLFIGFIMLTTGSAVKGGEV